MAWRLTLSAFAFCASAEGVSSGVDTTRVLGLIVEVFVVYQGDVPDSCEGMGMRAAIWKLSTQESLVISTCSTVALPFVGSEIPVDAFRFPLFKPFNE